jgi:cell division protein FtsW (lipid II flippase)
VVVVVVVVVVAVAAIGRTTYQPVLTTFLQPRHIPTRGYNITQSSAPDDGQMVARNMLSNY